MTALVIVGMLLTIAGIATSPFGPFGQKVNPYLSGIMFGVGLVVMLIGPALFG